MRLLTVACRAGAAVPDPRLRRYSSPAKSGCQQFVNAAAKRDATAACVGEVRAPLR